MMRTLLALILGVSVCSGAGFTQRAGKAREVFITTTITNIVNEINTNAVISVSLVPVLDHADTNIVTGGAIDWSLAGTGVITVSDSGVTVSGSMTYFSTEGQAGWHIQPDGYQDAGAILSIESDDSLTLTTNPPFSTTSQASFHWGVPYDLTNVTEYYTTNCVVTVSYGGGSSNIVTSSLPSLPSSGSWTISLSNATMTITPVP